jgi:hypothetical protein
MTDNATEIDFTELTVPADIAPPVEDTGAPFDPRYPDSTPEAPYGFKPNGEPYKRHHSGHGKTGQTSGRMPATGKQAETAAALLARLNVLVGFALTTAGMPESAMKLAENNQQFEDMARQALETDPALCRKILSAGATSGKAGLVMAYVVLGATTFPAMREEYKINHPKELESDDAAYS